MLLCNRNCCVTSSCCVTRSSWCLCRWTMLWGQNGRGSTSSVSSSSALSLSSTLFLVSLAGWYTLPQVPVIVWDWKVILPVRMHVDKMCQWFMIFFLSVFLFLPVWCSFTGVFFKNKSARHLLRFLMCHEWFPESFPRRRKNEKAKFQETLKVGDVFQGFSVKKEAGAYMDSFISKWCV